MSRLVLGLLLMISRAAYAAEPFARAAVETGGEIVPGQQVHVIVDVYAPDFFTSPPQFPLFDLPDALVTLPEERSLNTVQTIGGVQYAGIRRTYAVVPEKPGGYNLPPIRIKLGYSVDGKPTKGVAVTPSVAFDVGPGVKGSNSIAFAASGLTLTQSFDRDPSSLKKGEALVRTVVIFAEDTQAMMIPAVDLGDPEGLKQYAKPPRIEDDVQIERNHGSRRTETIVYTTEAEGSFDIPAVSYSWFDVNGHSQRTSSLPSVAVTAAAAVPRAGGIAPELKQEGAEAKVHAPLPAFVLGGLALLSVVAWVLGRGIRQIFSTTLDWFRLRTNSRRSRLRRLRTIILIGEEPAIYAALQDWSRSFGHRLLVDWTEAQRSPRLRAQIDILERRLFRSRDMQLDRRALANLLGVEAASIAPTSKSMLPELNPGARQGHGAAEAPRRRSRRLQ